MSGTPPLSPQPAARAGGNGHHKARQGAALRQPLAARQDAVRVEMRRFVLVREHDVSGVSGVGLVAEGVRFSNGVVSLHWLRDPGAIALYDTIGDLLAVHGHNGHTEVQWLDE